MTSPGTPEHNEQGRRKPVSLRHRLEFAVYRTGTGVMSRLPGAVGDAVGSCLGFLGGSVLRIRRGVVDQNLSHAFPDQSGAWRRRVARASYVHLVRESLALARISRGAPGTVLAETRVEGLDELTAALADGRGAIIVSAHLGNWEVGGSSVAVRGIPMHAVAFRQKNPLFNQDVVASRERLGMTVVFRNAGIRPLLKALRKGEVVALMSDQNVRRGGVFVDFLGRPASTARGAAVLSLRTGAPVFLGLCVRERPASVRYITRLLEVPVTEPSGHPGDDPLLQDRKTSGGGVDEEAVRALTQSFTAILEGHVREYPEQYFWQHRRWKTQPSREEPAPTRPV